MCGILVRRALNSSFHHVQLDSLRRRGPDAIGFWMNSDVQLGHTRLSIIGLDQRGDQPMENDRHVISFNGEIYNFEDIRRDLLARGVHLRGGSDTEILLNAWTLWGPAILPRLTGFWAFAVYDKATRVITLVRDQIGIKPLYYWHTKERTVASSLIRTILEQLPEQPSLDYEALSEYVRYQFTFGDKTFLKGIRKVLPGWYVELNCEDGSITQTCYEDILNPDAACLRPLTPELIEQTKALIVDCCRESTISDTAFTTFCSGGMDSSLITAITRPDVAYHCNYSDPTCNETFFAKEVIEHIKAHGGTTRLMVVNAQEDFDIVQRAAGIIEDFDELTIGSVIFPLDDLLARVKTRYKVILTGTGGDELFGGYIRYQLAMGHCYQDSYRMMFEKMAGVEGAARRFEITHTKGTVDLYKFYEPAVEQTFLNAFDQCRAGKGDLHGMMTFDRRYFLGGLLNIDDKMCGRHSLESRPSLLHQKLLRHVVEIEPTTLMNDKELKYLLRFSAMDYLPESIIRRVDKMGFTTPVGDFVNRSAHLIRQQVMDSRFRHLYDLKVGSFTAESKFSRETFGLMMLDLWLNRYATGNRAPERPA